METNDDSSLFPSGKRFARTVEDFRCGHCGSHNAGNGYTNHCTQCLWSRHVDVNPGDRAATCGGLMAPTGLEVVKDGYVITHACTAPGCDHRRKNKAGPDDSQEALIALSAGAYDYRADPSYRARQFRDYTPIPS